MQRLGGRTEAGGFGKPRMSLPLAGNRACGRVTPGSAERLFLFLRDLEATEGSG